MFPGDVIGKRCRSRVRAVKRELLVEYDTFILTEGIIERRVWLREQMILCATQTLPAKGRPPREAKTEVQP